MLRRSLRVRRGLCAVSSTEGTKTNDSVTFHHLQTEKTPPVTPCSKASAASSLPVGCQTPPPPAAGVCCPLNASLAQAGFNALNFLAHYPSTQTPLFTRGDGSVHPSFIHSQPHSHSHRLTHSVTDFSEFRTLRWACWDARTSSAPVTSSFGSPGP